MSIGKERLTGEKSPSEPASRVAKSFCNCCWIFHVTVPPSMRSKIHEGGVVVRSKIRELGGELRRYVTNRPEREVSLDRPVLRVRVKTPAPRLTVSISDLRANQGCTSSKSGLYHFSVGRSDKGD